MVKHGGHNVIEAAARGKAIIVGPHTDNFKDEVEYLRSRGALEIAENEQELASKWAAVSGAIQRGIGWRRLRLLLTETYPIG